MEVPKKFTTFQFEIVKKEPVSEDEIDNNYGNYFHPVEQVDYLKPELNLDYWNKKHNIDSIESKNIDVFCNIYSKLWCLWNPRVLLERLPDSALNKYSRLNVIDLKTENLCTETEKFDNFSENTSIEPVGGVTLRAKKFSNLITEMDLPKIIAFTDFNSPKGYEWNIEEYNRLIKKICDLGWQNRNIEELTEDDIATLTKEVKKWGDGRRAYFTSLKNFLTNYKLQVQLDCKSFTAGCQILPPELKNFRNFVEKAIEVMIHENFAEEINNYLSNDDSEICLNARQAMAQAMVPKSDANYDKNFRKFNNLIKRHRKELVTIMKQLKESQMNKNSKSRRSSRSASLIEDKNKWQKIETKITSGDESGFKLVQNAEKNTKTTDLSLGTHAAENFISNVTSP